MIRSILEGSAFALRHVVDEAEKSGQTVRSLSAVGGGSNSRIWLQIKANILDRPINTLRHSSSGAFGNALLAGYGVGLIDDVRDVVRQKIHIRETFYPQADQVGHYQKMYNIFRSLYEHTREDFRDLAALEH
jgi:xylulokinase